MASDRQERIARLLDGLSASGYRPAETFDPQAQPLDLLLARGRDQLRLRVFSWFATPGGPPGVRARGEMRVQTTRPGKVRLLGSRNELTLLLGYDERRDVFAAWDPRHHPDPGGSSSLQVDAATLDEAAQEGFAAQARRISGGEEEVVVAFQPEAIGAYFEAAPGLPGPRESQRAVRAAARAASGKAVPLEELPRGRERRRSIRMVELAARDARFRAGVRAAYHARCAFCGLDAGLIQAAHIQPVQADGPDLIANGLTACPTHHVAFDDGLVLIEDDLRITVNRRRLAERGVERTEADKLAKTLRKRLATPSDPALRPTPEYLSHHRRLWTAT